MAFEVFERAGTLASCEIVFGSKRSLRVVAIAGVQVDVEPTDERTTSAAACKEAMIIEKDKDTVVS